MLVISIKLVIKVYFYKLNCNDEGELLLTVFVVFEREDTGGKPDDYT